MSDANTKSETDGERTDAQIILRVTRRRKSGYVRAAQKKKQTLCEWMLDAADRAALIDT